MNVTVVCGASRVAFESNKELGGENRVLILAVSQACFMTRDKLLCFSASQMLDVGIRQEKNTVWGALWFRAQPKILIFVLMVYFFVSLSFHICKL